jgi:dihydropteroate synthase
MSAASRRVYLRPTGLAAGPEAARLVAAGAARWLIGGPLAFATVERVVWDGAGAPERANLPVSALAASDLAPFTAPHPPPFERPRVMGILNVTPDSFSDGGAFLDPAAAVEHGLALRAAGADIVDVGGESTRPGAAAVPLDEELRRALPVVERLAAAGATVSIDTRKAAVMRAAVAAGAVIVNDVSGLAFDPEAAAAVAASGARVVLMHMRGTPASMNRAPAYRCCALEVMDELRQRIDTALAAGIARERLIVDPGLCFAKHEPHNLELLRDLALLHGLGCPVLLGASRKGWAHWIEARHRPRERLPASLAAAQWALDRGARILRVHDVAATRQLVDAWATLAGSPSG